MVTEDLFKDLNKSVRQADGVAKNANKNAPPQDHFDLNLHCLLRHVYILIR